MILDRYEKEVFFNELDSNNILQKIIKSIYYTDTHNVDILTINAADTLTLVLEYIDNTLKNKFEKKEIIRFKLNENLEDFFLKVQQYYNKEGDFLFIFDGTTLDESVDYEYIFMMINKERNLFLEKLNAPMLLVLPKSLQQSFAHVASDFWSVKKYSADIRLEEKIKAVSKSELEVPQNNNKSEEIFRNYQKLEEQFKKDKNNIKTERL